jgi:hypothetical protein
MALEHPADLFTGGLKFDGRSASPPVLSAAAYSQLQPRRNLGIILASMLTWSDSANFRHPTNSEQLLKVLLLLRRRPTHVALADASCLSESIVRSHTYRTLRKNGSPVKRNPTLAKREMLRGVLRNYVPHYKAVAGASEGLRKNLVIGLHTPH